MPAALLRPRINPGLFVFVLLLPRIRGDCGSPPKLINAAPQESVHAESFPTNTAITYRCLDGFYNIHGKLDVTTCLSNSQWSPIEAFCESSCPAPTSLKYAQAKSEEVKKTYYTPGTTVTYACRQGYDSIPGMSPVITCLQNNTWSEVQVFCKGKSCGDPGKPQNGRAVILTDLLYRSKVNFTCDDGYRLVGSPFTQCSLKNNTAKWNSEPPDCQPITCSSPPNITGGIHDGESFENFAYNSTITYKCNDGFSLTGEASVHCRTEDKITGNWTGPAPECKGDCGPPQRTIGTQQKQESQDSYPVGTILTYTCIPGYEPIPGTRPSIVCNEHSEWSGAPEFCQGKRCPIPNIENGRVVEDSDFRLGAQITFACEVGYRLIGANGARCILRSSSMAWDRTPPHCQRIPCFPPPNIPNGRHDGRDDYVYGTAVTYRCDDPFSLIGNKTLVCLSDQDDNGRWSSDAPRCAVVKCQIPTVPNGIMVTSYRPSYTYQDRVVFRCNDGYHLKENKGDISCGANNTWEPHLPECILGSSGGDEGTTTPPAGIPCFPPPNIPNGRHDGRDDYVYGTAVTYRCDDPFSLIGNKTLMCLSDQDDNGRWSSDAPQCAVVKCHIPIIQNGIMVTSYRPSYTYQDRVVFRCNDGYHLKGNKGDISCGANNTWEPHLPECILGSSGGDEGTTTPPADGTLLPTSGSSFSSLFGTQASPVTAPAYTSSLPTSQTELAWEKLFIMLQEVKDIINIKAKSLEESLKELEKKVDKVIYEGQLGCHQAKEENLGAEDQL